MYNCDVCNYTTGRKDNYLRHMKSDKHINKSAKSSKEIPIIHQQQNNQSLYTCTKCSEDYKTKKHYDHHIKICTGIDSKTCPKCMKTFTDRGNKSRHIKNNSCKPVSIFEYLKRKHQPSTPVQNNKISNSTVNNSFNTVNNTNIYVNNYGKERTDYITYDDFLSIIKCCNTSIIPNYIKMKYFYKIEIKDNHI